MSVPPAIIRVKRKADEDAPQFLRIEDNKRHRSEVYVYQRQDAQAAFADIPDAIQRPVIHTSSPREQRTTSRREKLSTASHVDREDGAEKHGSSDGSAHQPRRFFLSRKHMMDGSSDRALGTRGGVSKKRMQTAVFVERKIKRLSSRKMENSTQTVRLAPEGSGTLPSVTTTEEPNATTAVPGSMDVDFSEPKRYKQPGVNRLKPHGSTKPKSELPKAMVERWNVDLDQLTADMNAFTMDHIADKLRRSEEERRVASSPQAENLREYQVRSQPQQLRFKPMKIKRYHERHPAPREEPINQAKVKVDDDFTEVEEEEGHSLFEQTYVRVPLSALEQHKVAPGGIGYLAFDQAPDADFFYGDPNDSDDEYADDDEDENAENYYTADYPEEELDEDGEDNHNAYLYRTAAAADLEEYDFGRDVDDEERDDGDDDEGEEHEGREGREMGDNNDDGFKTYVGPRGQVSKHL